MINSNGAVIFPTQPIKELYMILSTIRCILLTMAIVSTAAFSTNAADSVDNNTTGSGTVLETMDAANYTYMNLKTAGGNVWVALPATEIEVGDEVTYVYGMTMSDFQSKTIDRTFKSIIFSPGLVTEAADATPPITEKKKNSSSTFSEALQEETKQSETIKPQEQLSPGSMGATVPYMETEVEKASGENGYRVAELYEKADSLDGKQVRVRGRVVKVSPNIMGKNWIHLQDGTGDPMQNTHDLVITSNELTEVDEIVVAEGTVAADKDFGFGYEYAVLVEQATLSK